MIERPHLGTPAQRHVRRRGERSDVKFFERNPDRRYRVRRSFRREFGADEAESVVVKLVFDMPKGVFVTSAMPVTASGPIPDDDRLLGHLWTVTETQVSEHGLKPFDLSITGAMMSRIMAA